MVIWRGWGILAVLFLGAGAGLGSAVGGRVGLVLGLLVGAAACWAVGQRMNATGPAAKVAAYREARAAELHAMADAGTFHLGAGHPAPTSYEEAHAQADYLANAEADALKGRGHNAHTLFFIPMQFWAFVGALLAVLAAVGVIK